MQKEKTTEIEKRDTMEKKYGLFLPLLMSIIIALSIGFKTQNLLFTIVSFLILFFVLNRLATKMFIVQAKEFKNRLSLLGLQIKGSSIPYNPTPLYGEGNYNGANVRVGKVTTYEPHSTKSNMVLAVKTNEKHLAFHLSKVDTVKNGNNNYQMNEIDNFLEQYKLQSENEYEAKKFVEKNLGLIKHIFEHAKVLYLNKSLRMADDKIFSELGLIGTILKNDNRMEQTLSLLVTLSKQI